MARLLYAYQTIPVLLTLPFLTSPTPLPLPPCSFPDLNTRLWNFSDWSTNYTLPDGGAVSFRLDNNLTGYGALCVRVGLYPEGYCVWAQGGTGEEDDTGTLFTYYEGVEELSVYQEWSCVAESGTKRTQAEGKVMVRDPSQCGPGHEMKKGEMCGLQGGEGVIYPTLVQATPTE